MKDLKYAIAAVICSIGSLSLSYEFMFGIYLAIGYLWLNAVIMILVYSIVASPDVFPVDLSKYEGAHRNYTLQFFVHVITGFFLYSLYIHGYLFSAFFLSCMLTMSFSSNIITFFASTKDTQK